MTSILVFVSNIYISKQYKPGSLSQQPRHIARASTTKSTHAERAVTQIANRIEVNKKTFGMTHLATHVEKCEQHDIGIEYRFI